MFLDWQIMNVFLLNFIAVFFVNLHGFHMVNTRSVSNKKQEETMGTITNKMKCYFEKLIEPLATNKSLEYLFNKLKDYLFKKFDEKISEQNAKIEKLESIISIQENKIDKLLIKCNDNEQYSRRSCCVFME